MNALLAHIRRNSLLLSMVILAVGTFISCKNDININASWKETIVVYGLLDPSDSVQFIRIEKAYLNTKTSALEIAKISDSLETGSAIVTLTSVFGTINLQKVYYVKKDSGLFGNDKNPLWKTNDTIKPNVEYTLNFVNTKTGKKISAVAGTVGPATLVSPVRNASGVFTIVPAFISNEFGTGDNSSAYDVRMDVFYDEFSKTDSNTKVGKTVSWNMVTDLPVTPKTIARMQVPRLAFLQFLSNNIKADKQVWRRMKSITLTWTGGNQTLVDYISVNQPSIGIVQKTAEFSNIQGGIGIFASRNIQTISKIRVDDASVSIIILNAETAQLNFIR